MTETLKKYACEICGGELREIEEAHYKCPYCRTEYYKEITLPDELVLDLHSANRERTLQKFEDALNEYDRILASYPDCFDAYWGATLSEYGIQYERDYDDRMIPTVHRYSEIPVFENKYYLNALKYCKNDKEKARVEKSAAEIEGIRENIQKTVGTQQPYDIFLCYKETLVGGGGFTPEFYWADELYRRLKGEGYRVFFAKESLPAARGDYEAHIFPALKSARLMLILTTSVDHVESVWVKNEWSRFIRFSRENTAKRFKVVMSGFKPETLPRELRKEQALNHDGIGWFEQLTEILKDTFPKKYISHDEIDSQSDSLSENEAEISFLLKRMYAFLTVGSFESADEYSERVLSIAPDNAEAYLGKLMLEFKIKERQELQNHLKPFENSENYIKALEYGSDELKKELKEYSEIAEELRCENRKLKEKQKKKNKKIVIFSSSIIVAVLAVFGILRFFIYPYIPEKSLKFTLNSNGSGYAVSIGDCRVKNLIIPDTYNNMPVTEISDNCFENFKPENLTIPKSITSIGENAFSGIFYENSLTNVYYLGDIYSWCNINFKNAGSTPFLSSKNFYIENTPIAKELVIPDNVTSIPDYAFWGISNVSVITIGKNVTTIGKQAFDACYNISEININATNLLDFELNNFTFPQSKSTEINVFFGDNVKKIPSNMFSSNNIKNVIIGSSVESIGSASFFHCENLTSITIGANVKAIGRQAFDNCINLESIKYRGTEEQWKEVSKAYRWDNNTGNYTIIYNYTGE